MRVHVEADGGSRGNPGVAGYGAVVRDDAGAVLAERREYIGTATNNVAEYRGLIAGLEAAARPRRPRGGREDGLEARRGADVGALEGQAPGHDSAGAAGARGRGRLRPGALPVDSPRPEQARRPVGERGDGRAGARARGATAEPSKPEGPRGREPTPSAVGRARSGREAFGPRLDGCHRPPHPAAAAAARPDGALDRAPILRSRQPDAHRPRPRPGRAVGADGGGQGRYRGRGVVAVGSCAGYRAGVGAGVGPRGRGARRADRDRLRRLGGRDVPGGRRALSGPAPPVARRRVGAVRRTGRASSRSASGSKPCATISSRGTPARTCWW